MSGELPESELIRRCQRGDTQAWDILFDLHYAPTARFLYQISPDISVEDADELCQEVFLAAIRNLKNFKAQSRLRTWLFRIATNKARDFRQKQTALKRGGGSTPISLDEPHPQTGLTLDPASQAPGPDQAMDAGEQGQMIQQALEHLGDPCREIIELRYFGDLSYEEISNTLKLNPKTVSSRLSKCLDKLEALYRRMISRENKQENHV